MKSNLSSALSQAPRTEVLAGFLPRPDHLQIKWLWRCHQGHILIFRFLLLVMICEKTRTLFALRPEIEFLVLAVREEKIQTYPWEHTASHMATRGIQSHIAIFKEDFLSPTAV